VTLGATPHPDRPERARLRADQPENRKLRPGAPTRGGRVPRAEPLPPAADPRARGTLSVSSVRCQL
jgi:hypothetical protein